MQIVNKVSGLFATGTLLCALSMPANALIITYDDIVTGAVPDAPATWLTASITNATGGGVNVTLTPGVSSPEFITSIFFSLTGEFALTDPATEPDITRSNCSGQAPAGTGPWQLCMSFSPNDQWNTSDGAVSFFLRGLRESNFVYNSDGWRSVAHVQGIQPNCSSWVGDYRATGGIAPSNSGSCAPVTSVPEPGTLGLLGLGLAAIGLTRRRRRVTAA